MTAGVLAPGKMCRGTRSGEREDLQSRICSFWELHPVVNATSGDQTSGSRQHGQPAWESSCLPGSHAMGLKGTPVPPGPCLKPTFAYPKDKGRG